MFKSEQLNEKWQPVLEHTDLPEIKDPYRRAVTTVLLENQEKAMQEQALMEAAPVNATGASVAGFDPILISLVRRAMPHLIAYDICGVQPMTGPTGLIFAMKSKYSTQGGAEALFDEADSDFSGAGTHTGSANNGDAPGALNDAASGSNVHMTHGTGLATATGEALGDASGNYFPEMAFSIEKTTVTAKTRALKAEYTMELSHDLKAVHGLDAEGELANILSQEILQEINREIVRRVYIMAKEGVTDATTAGELVTADVDGQWSVERFKGIAHWIEKEANVIARTTRRGKGNILICSSNVASALAQIGSVQWLEGGVPHHDMAGNTFIGTINGTMKVFVDPYVSGDYFVVGYRGASAYDAGMFYCPYVPLQMVRAMGEQTFQPKIAFKTRYGIADNPFVTAGANNNVYYRRTKIGAILGF
jgi:hypothetical protein